MTNSTLHRDDYELVETCSACPEQYDVFLDGQQVGYLRLRHGYFSASYPDAGGEDVYNANPEGDGIFEPEERNFYINAAIASLDKRHQEGPVEREADPRHNTEQQGWSLR